MSDLNIELSALDDATLETFLGWYVIADAEANLSADAPLAADIREILESRVKPHAYAPFSPRHYVCYVRHCNKHRNDPIHEPG